MDIEETRENRELEFFKNNVGNLPKELLKFEGGLQYPNQPERSKREDSERRCGTLNSMET